MAENNTGQTSEEGNDVSEDKLKLIKRRLYAREESAEVQRRKEELHRLGITRQSKQAANGVGTLASAKYKNLALIRAKRLGRVLRFSGLLTLLLVLVIAGVAATVWYRSTQTVTEAQVALTLEAPQDFTAGNEIVYKVFYANESRVDWTNVELAFAPPRGFTFRDSNRDVEQIGRQVALSVGNLASGETGELHVRGQLIGEQNEAAVAQAEFFLTPENFPSGRFSKTVVLASTITALPLDVSLNIPGDAASGERVFATISVRNLSSNTLDGVYLRVLPAPEVQLATRDQEFSEGFRELGSEWLLPQMDPLEEADRAFVFHVEGQPGEKRVIDIEAGIRQDGEDFVQRELTHVVTVSATEVVVQQVYNGSVDPLIVQAGETVNGEVKYQNIGSVGLKDAIIGVVFDGIAFDAGSLTLSGAGAYDPVSRSITWSAATVPELGVIQPQQEGTLNYSFKILPTDGFPISGDATKNQVLVTTATVDSPTLPAPVGQPRKVISDRAVLSVGTDPILEADSLYDDGRLGLTSTGPLPPVVGQTTTYTLRFRIGSTLNDMANVQLVAVLPDGVVYTNTTYATAGEVRFNDRTGELVWTMPFVEGLTGRATPHQELHVQVAITPGEDKRGNAVALLNKVELEAVDQFTEEAVTSSLNNFPDTATAAPGKGSVQ